MVANRSDAQTTLADYLAASLPKVPRRALLRLLVAIDALVVVFVGLPAVAAALLVGLPAAFLASVEIGSLWRMVRPEPSQRPDPARHTAQLPRGIDFTHVS
ncbi:MAG: hypothetical protein OEY23_09510 [Acidimicrobiia bacterium]|nr:hypothetical protein [Acidimicrobiia bacterium]